DNWNGSSSDLVRPSAENSNSQKLLVSSTSPSVYGGAERPICSTRECESYLERGSISDKSSSSTLRMTVYCP
ncbi:MAG: hypothetical protein KDK40_05960, partial [Chlamydiia bacterium]|nr:hypothetical protein [Chlamydiia bacterium]